ncbi:FHA domain-containing protein [Propionibacterium australiense]|uniref:FHA domain-containing protein n=1 Tax=Propionibacterium australiense TaxID=119981 RepID=A0A8B3FQA2_9ACTN|nr:FHA domain-containing protein [Propionibacterium australiense]RLP07555.1 FHA domain-containing protein [Propionibacterium australiense]
MADQVNDAANARSRNSWHAGLGGWRVSYQPGSWLVLSGPSSLVMLDAQPGQASEFVNELWEDVVGAASVGALVSKLAARGLDRIADLAVLFIENGVMRTLVRGGVRVLDAETGSPLVEGTGVITWREAQIPTGRVRVDVGQSTGGLELPLVVGAAQCSGLLVDLNDLPPVAVEEELAAPAQPVAGARGEQWLPVGESGDGAPLLAGPVPGAGHHRDWGGPVPGTSALEAGAAPAAETADARQPAGSSPAATMQFDVPGEMAEGRYDQPGPSSEEPPAARSGQEPAQGESADATPMNWMAQQPRDDSFMYEKTEVLGGGQSALGEPGQSSTGSHQRVPAADEAAAQQYVADEAAAQQYVADEAAAQQPGNEPAPAWDDKPWTPADGYGPAEPATDQGFGSSPEQYAPAERTLGQEPVGADRPAEQYGPAERTLGQEAVESYGAASPSRGDWSPPEQPRAFAQVVTISGLSQPLNGPLLIGRSPQLPEGMVAETLRVPSPHHDISRSHVYLEPQNGQVLVADMNSTNGTIVYMPNANPLRLEDGQSILVPVGTTLDLGDGEQVNLSVPLG